MPRKSKALQAIERIEKRLGEALPAEYRDYLLAGLPWEDDRCELAWGPGNDYPDVVDVREPYHFDEAKSEGDPTIEFMLDIYSKRSEGDGRIPKDSMSIASCESGEAILLFIRGPRRGQIWLKHWRTLEETGADDPESDLHFVAKSFTEFLDKLEESDFEEWDDDDEERVILYVPDATGKLLWHLDFDTPFPPSDELDRTRAGQWDAVGFEDKKKAWRLGFGGPDAQRMIDILRPALADLSLPKGSHFLINDDPKQRVDL